MNGRYLLTINNSLVISVIFQIIFRAQTVLPAADFRYFSLFPIHVSTYYHFSFPSFWLSAQLVIHFLLLFFILLLSTISHLVIGIYPPFTWLSIIQYYHSLSTIIHFVTYYRCYATLFTIYYFLSFVSTVILLRYPLLSILLSTLHFHQPCYPLSTISHFIVDYPSCPICYPILIILVAIIHLIIHHFYPFSTFNIICNYSHILHYLLFTLIHLLSTY